LAGHTNMAQTGYTPISIYYSSTATNVPTAGNLVAGELAINTADGKLFYKDSSGVVQVIAGKGGAGVAGGSNTQVQYNSSGSLTGSANMTFSGTALTLANDASISGLTVGKGGGADIYTTAVGYQALLNGTNPIYSSAFGYQAGKGITTGQANTAIGREVMNIGTVTGASNTGIGNYALHVLSTGSNNFAGGESSLLSNTTGSSNTAIGTQSLNANTTASNNTAVGFQAGYNNTTGANCFFGGYQAGYGSTATNSIGIGYQALYAANSGTNNVGVGILALTANTSGTQNTAIGGAALYTNTTGGYNTAIGYGAGNLNTTGQQNTFIGRNAGSAVTTGTLNMFIGDSSGQAITTGGKNTIIGSYQGNSGGLDIRTASNYIVLSDGDGNPRGVFDGSGNLYLNTTTQNDSGKFNINFTSVSNIGIGIKQTNNSTGTLLNFINYLGNSMGSISCVVTSTAYNTSSDYRLKENIAPMSGALNKILQLKPVTYKWKINGAEGQGFIAHELQSVVPDCVTGEKDAIDAEGKPVYQGIDTSFLVATLTAAIQELKAEFDAYKATHP